MRLSEPVRQAFSEKGVSEDQLEFEWSRIRDRIQPNGMARRGGQLALIAAIGVVVFAATTTLLSRGKAPQVSNSGPGIGGAMALTGPTTTTLLDGSRIDVTAGSKVLVLERPGDATRVVIHAGEASFDVTHRPERTFTVSAASVDVRVVGTQFKVRIEDRAAVPGVTVAVSRGAVEVMSTELSAPVRVQTGQERLFGPATAPPRTPASLEMPQMVTAKGADASGRMTDAQRLFEQANLARRAGRAGEAAHLYQSMLSRFPGNKRAGLAALELGRLRMDTLGDLSGAAEALRRAVKTIPSGSLHEDAQARLVDALDGLHDWAGCGRARKDYLRRYRHGVHAIAVDARCAVR